MFFSTQISLFRDNNTVLQLHQWTEFIYFVFLCTLEPKYRISPFTTAFLSWIHCCYKNRFLFLLDSKFQGKCWEGDDEWQNFCAITLRIREVWCGVKTCESIVCLFKYCVSLKGRKGFVSIENCTSAFFHIYAGLLVLLLPALWGNTVHKWLLWGRSGYYENLVVSGYVQLNMFLKQG